MLLDVRGLCATYDSPEGSVRAVEGADLHLEEGESLGVAGESACGKSTLGLAIAGSLRGGRASGTVLLDGVDLLGIPPAEFDKKYRWKEVSVIFQGAMNSLDPVFRVRDQLDEVLRHHGAGGDPGAAGRAMTSVGLDPGVLDMYPHELSGGMRQRVVIAMALLLGPRLVVADEPTTSLDVLVQAQITNLLKKMREGGTSFILITHDLAVLAGIADRVAVMYAGQIVEFGTAEEVYGSPRHPYTKALLESVPTMRGPPPGHIPGSPPDLASPPAGCRFMDRCPEALEKCREAPPCVKTGTGYVRCWLY
ncbi:MAG: ABC transporter ATP-binding protein [Nitrosopumilus sp.]|nr:ABC transporter ATP-binding protein [Nitrosopumilus sp.]MDA7958598.1 ABC transporter ATP-binding protein [Nitrosopumilus sp.]